MKNLMNGYALVFCDEFDYNGAPDPSKWLCEVGNHKWHNDELQAYTDRPGNVIVKDGKLIITALKEQDGQREYTSTRLNSVDAWQHGIIQVSAKLPKGNGSWPAIWMLGENLRDGVGWPLCGEIDIMEHVGKKEDEILFSLHSEKRNHAIGTERTVVDKVNGMCDDFHEYAIHWTAEFIEFFVDGQSYAKFSVGDDKSAEDWPFNQPFYMILNIAVGGFLGGPVDENTMPYVMEIDYVRVYQKGE